ncbi:hypothetical protein C8Q80DRAFT_1122299 [Daedaleopsis nitida]|nr:hypothetical protein C8Q80DRAFT_1122299 [Daedaleopsis nitida]
MDPRYPYYPSQYDSSSSSSSSSSQQPNRHTYPRASDSATPSQATHPYAYAQQQPVSSSYHPGAAYPDHPSQPYHSSPTQTTSNLLPPLAHGASTLHDLPFSAPRASSSSAVPPTSRSSWGSTQPASRTQPLYGSERPPYPPSRQSSQPHLSLSHSTANSHLIPTPAQTAQVYHSFQPSASASASSSSAPVAPVIAAIPPAMSSAPPQERFYCERCEKSFGRQHDKKRHFESTHLQQSHACRFCTKTFSRNDSLKRHQDNGCDKDPEFAP